MLRQFLKGWGAKKAGELRGAKERILLQLEELDKLAHAVDLSIEEWQARYELESSLEQIYQVEEIHWKQRGDVQWLLEGDSNTNFFSISLPMVEDVKTLLSPWKLMQG